VKALWQSFLDPEEHRPYFDRLRAMLAAVAPDVDFDVVGLRPPDRHLHALTEVRCGVSAIRNALYAEQHRYDAIAIGHFQEPLLTELRLAVGAPVAGLGESSLAAAAGRFGLIAISEVFVPWHTEQVRRCGLEQQLVGVESVELEPDGFMLAMEGGEARQRLLELVSTAAARLASAGAETVLPAGALVPVALWDETGASEVPFLDPVVCTVDALGRARAGEGMARRPAEAVREFLEATGGPLVEPLR